MKIKILFIFAVLLSFSAAVFAQTVKVIPQKTVYRRAVKKDFAHKKTFTVIRPKISGLSAALNRKIENAISYERIFEFNLKEEQTEIFWLDSAEFKTEYNRSGMLGIALTMDGSGAYPSVYTKHVVVDTKTGLQVKPADIFANAKTAALVNLLDERFQERVKLAIAEVKKDSAEDAATLTEMLAEKKFTAENLNHFSVNDKGVSFYYDYGFPHVMLALEPGGEFFMSYADLKSFVKPGGLLAKFAR